MKFFFDNNLAPKIAKGLNEFVRGQHQVVHLKERFPSDTADCIWMTDLANEAEWVIVTADGRMGKNLHEVEAWKQAGHTIFFLKPGWLKLVFWEQAHKFVKCFPEIIKEAEQATSGSSFIVSVSGKIEK